MALTSTETWHGFQRMDSTGSTTGACDQDHRLRNDSLAQEGREIKAFNDGTTISRAGGELDMKPDRRTLLVAAVMALWAGSAVAERKHMPPDAKVYIIWPADGQVIPSGKFWIRMGLSNGGVAPAGVVKAGTGHHHLLVDCDLPPLDQEVPNDKNHLHFGRGQTEAHLELPPGKHTLQLLFADDAHVPHDPPLYSKKIAIIVPR